MRRRIMFGMAGVLLFLSACATETETVPEGAFTVYELNMTGTEMRPVSFQLQEEAPLKQVDESIMKLSSMPEEGEYKNTLPADVTVLDRSLTKNGLLSLNFSTAYLDMAGNEPLIRAAVVRTLCGIDGVKKVTFSVDGVPLTDLSGDVIGEMSEESFIFDFEDRDLPNQKADLTLYYLSSDGSGLVQERHTVDYNSNTPLGRVVLNELTKMPNSKKAESPLPATISVTSYAVSDGICYLTLDVGLSSQLSESAGQLAIHAIVNSLTELSNINRVMLTVEGEDAGPASISGMYDRT